MGSVSTHYGTELSLTLEELGVTDGHTKVIHKAAGGTRYGEKRTWFVLERVDTGERELFLALTSRGEKYGVWCKVVSETMGPAELDVPDLIWNNLPPDPGYYATEWRKEVAAFRAEWPYKLKDVPVGMAVKVLEHGDTYVRVAGEHKGSPLFTRPDGRRTYFANSRIKRAKAVA